MRSLRCLVMGLVLVSVLPYAVRGQGEVGTSAVTDTSQRSKDPRTAFLLGLIPGGGQIYNGAWLKALLVIAAEGYYIHQFQQNRDFYNHYDEYDLEEDRDWYLGERNKFAWRALFVYLLGMMDGYVDAHLSTFPPDTTYQVQPPSTQSREESP